MEWISTKDKLPTRENGYDWVLVIAKMNPENYFGVPAVAELRSGVWYFRDEDKPAEDALGIKVTHWMDLPKPPKE
jgi:hypothetical protein